QAREVVQRRRMPDAEDEDQESKQKPPRVEEAQSEQDGDRGPGQVELAAPEERPRDVAPVQLPCRQEIDRGHEEPDPAREGERVNAPNVPRGGTDGKKNGRDAWTLYRFATR